MLPREKLNIKGPEGLEDHELMSLLICRGNKNENVFQISKRLFKDFDREELLTQKNPRIFQNSLNIGAVQTSQIMACIELGRRFFAVKASNLQIRSTEDVYEIVKNMQYLKKEYLRGLYINTRYRIIHDEILSIGSLDSSILHPRDIFRPALEYNAYGVILAHNHPSGEIEPSSSDIETTKQVIHAGTLLQIPLMDHIIVGSENYFSFNKNNLMRE